MEQGQLGHFRPTTITIGVASQWWLLPTHPNRYMFLRNATRAMRANCQATRGLIPRLQLGPPSFAWGIAVVGPMGARQARGAVLFSCAPVIPEHC